MRKFMIVIAICGVLLSMISCSDDTDDSKAIVPIEEGNYWVYTAQNGSADTLHYEQCNGLGPDSLGGWWWVCWSSYGDDSPFIVAKNQPEGYSMYWNTRPERGYYDLRGRRVEDPAQAVNQYWGRDDVLSYVLYKYPAEIDEEWTLFTSDMFGSIETKYKGRYDLDTEIDVAAGSFDVMRYTYFCEPVDPEEELPDEILIELERSYCQPGRGNIADASHESEEVWDIYQELSDYRVE